MRGGVGVQERASGTRSPSAPEAPQPLRPFSCAVIIPLFAVFWALESMHRSSGTLASMLRHCAPTWGSISHCSDGAGHALSMCTTAQDPRKAPRRSHPDWNCPHAQSAALPH